MRSDSSLPTPMLRVVARFRMLTALLLLLAGQLGAAASAQAATCPRAEARQRGALVVPAAADPGALGVRPADDRRHDVPSPVGESTSLVPTACTSTAALPERPADVPLQPGRTLRSSAWAESPPRDLLLSGFFRPPRPS